MARDSAAHVDERVDEVHVEAVTGLERPGHVGVIVGIRVGSVGVQGEQQRPNDHSEPVEGHRNPHGARSVASAGSHSTRTNDLSAILFLHDRHPSPGNGTKRPARR